MWFLLGVSQMGQPDFGWGCIQPKDWTPKVARSRGWPSVLAVGRSLACFLPTGLTSMVGVSRYLIERMLYENWVGAEWPFVT